MNDYLWQRDLSFFEESEKTIKLTINDNNLIDINSVGVKFFDVPKKSLVQKPVSNLVKNYHDLQNILVDQTKTYMLNIEFNRFDNPGKIKRYLGLIKNVQNKNDLLYINFPFLCDTNDNAQIAESFRNILKYFNSISHGIYGPILVIEQRLNMFHQKGLINDDEFKNLERLTKLITSESKLLMYAFHDMNHFNIIESMAEVQQILSSGILKDEDPRK